MTEQYNGLVLEAMLTKIYTGWGIDAVVSGAISRNMVYAHQTGHATHGVHLLRRYGGWLRGKLLTQHAVLREINSGILTRYDAERSFGHWALPEAIKRTALMDSEVKCFTIKNLGHTGNLSACIKEANILDHLTLVWLNTSGSKLVRPYNGKNKMMSTTCMALSIPGVYGFDMTLPSTSENSVQHALMSGKNLTVPLIAESNSLTFNPADLYCDPPTNQNAIGSKTAIRFNDHKMFNLGILGEILSGVISDSGTSQSNVFHSGCFGLMIKLTDNNKANVQNYVNWLKSSGNVRLPGDKYQDSITLSDWEVDILSRFIGE